MPQPERPIYLLPLLTALMLAIALFGCGEPDEDFGEPYEPFQGVWVTEVFEEGDFEQWVELDVDGADAINEIYSAETDEVVYKARYRYLVGDEIEVSFDGETVDAKQIDLRLVEIIEGEQFTEFPEGTEFHDILRITELDDDTVAYMSFAESTDPEVRPDTLADIPFTRQ